MIATSGFLAALECTKFVFGRGFARDPAWGANYTAPPRWEGKRTGKEEEKGRGRGRLLPYTKSWIHSWFTLLTALHSKNEVAKLMDVVTPSNIN